MRFRCLVTLLTCLAPLRAAAQPVTGMVVEEGRGIPVSGAMVILFDEGGDRIDRMLTNAAGRFALQARASGTHYLTVERIGYANVTTDRFTAGAGEVSLTIDVPIEPVVLTGLDVEAGRRCEVRPEEGRVTARVWEEVRKALAAEAWTREASLYTYTLRRYERMMDRDARFVLTDSSTISTDHEAAFVSAPIETLAAEGFVQAEGDSSSVYYAPDAGALLSDAFLDTHCLSVRDGGEGQIGLMFEPVPERWVPDIAGVLWLDAETAELDWLEFGYVNLIRSREIGEPGGEVSFARLPNGAWIVRDWWIRMPRLEPTSRGRIRRVAYNEEGGVTQSISDTRDRTLLQADAATIFGVVTDSTGTGPPDQLVQVAVLGGGMSVVPDEDGSFVFSGLSPGQYTLRVRRPLFHRLGLASPDTMVEGRLGEVSYARLRVPALADILAAACGGAPRPDGTSVVLARITEANGRAVGSARVSVRWPAATGYESGPLAAPPGPQGEPVYLWESGREGHYATVAATTDARGFFLLCDVPHGSRLDVAIGPPSGGPVVSRTIFVPTDTHVVFETIELSTLHDIM